MSEYIDRCKLIEEGWHLQKTVLGDDSVHIERASLLDIPTADVRPVVRAVWKHIQWVVDEEWQEGGYWISRCSNCSMPYHTETPFCPHCGADMREQS